MKKPPTLNFELVIALVCLAIMGMVFWRSNPVPPPEHLAGPDFEIWLYRHPTTQMVRPNLWYAIAKPEGLEAPFKLTWRDLAGYDRRQSAILLTPEAARRLAQVSQWMTYDDEWLEDKRRQVSSDWLWFEIILKGQPCLYGTGTAWVPGDGSAGVRTLPTLIVTRTGTHDTVLYLTSRFSNLGFTSWHNGQPHFGTGMESSDWQPGRAPKTPRCLAADPAEPIWGAVIDERGLERLFRWYGKLLISEE